MTQKEAAEALGMSESGYRKIENGDRGLEAEMIRKAADLFGVEPSDIVRGLAQRTPQDGDIDHETLARLISTSRQRLGSITEAEAIDLVMALISAARRPRKPRA